MLVPKSIRGNENKKTGLGWCLFFFIQKPINDIWIMTVL